ncbi:MAG: PucR family transcriptional regulator ligand-binding domain-containing protein [Bacillota bacterium]|nr:PucR family transcriptional regulator ligand-binding domain-containing protein [Bacillota bacterium]
MLTVGEALGIGVMQRARLIAGAGGLGRVIRTITVMDTPDIKNWLRGGELLLSNIFVIKDNPEEQVRLVQDLAERGAAGLGIKLKRYVESIQPRMLELADSLDLPLIEMPVDCAWIDVMIPLYTEIINRQAARLSRAWEIHDTFTRAALEGRSIQGVLELLSSLTGSAAAMVDAEGNILGAQPPGSWDEAAIRWALPGAQGANGPVLPPDETPAAENRRVFPVKAGKRLHGYVLLQAPGQISEADFTALEHAATVLALEMAKLQAISEVERRFENQLLWDLLNGNITTKEALESRARHAGMKLAPGYAVIVLDIDGFERYCLEVLRDEEKAQEVRERFARTARSSAAFHMPSSLCMDLSDSVTVLVPVVSPDRGDLVRLAAAIRNETLGALPGLTVSGGISRVCRELQQLPGAYREARQAIELGKELKGAGHITDFDELGSYRVLLSSGNRAEIERFYREILGPLEEQEQPELIETVAAFFRCNCNPVRCARELFVHPNTVRYRLRKFEALSGISLGNQEDLFNLQLALKLRRLMGHKTQPDNTPRTPPASNRAACRPR